MIRKLLAERRRKATERRVAREIEASLRLRRLVREARSQAARRGHSAHIHRLYRNTIQLFAH